MAWREQTYDRKAVFLYAGDFDASGIAIDRVFGEYTVECFADVHRIALNPPRSRTSVWAAGGQAGRQQHRRVSWRSSVPWPCSTRPPVRHGQG
jgi:hypothetical protein